MDERSCPAGRRVSGPALFVLLAAGVVLASGCAYLNTLYNAEQAYEEGVRIRGDADSLPAPAREAFDRAIEKSAVVLSRHPDSSYVDDALLLLARSLSQVGRYDDAARTYRDYLARFPDEDESARARFELARIERLRGDHPAARVALDGLLGEVEGDLRAEILYERALVALDTDRHEEATASFETLLEERPEWARKHAVAVRFADAKVAAGQWRDAMAAYRSYVEGTPDPGIQRESALRLSRALAKGGLHEEALEILDDLLATGSLPDPVEAVVQVERGTSLEARGAWQEAEAAYREAMGLAPGTEVGARAAYGRGRIVWRVLGQREAAQEILLDAFIHAPSSAWGDSARADARALERLIHFRRIVEGEIEVPGVEERDEARATALFRLAEETLESERDRGRAIEVYERLVRDYPGSTWVPRARLAIGLLEREEGNEARARRVLADLVADHPDDPVADSARVALGLPVSDRPNGFYSTSPRVFTLAAALPDPEDPMRRIVDQMDRYTKKTVEERREDLPPRRPPAAGRGAVGQGGQGGEAGQAPGLPAEEPGAVRADEIEREPGLGGEPNGQNMLP